MALSACGSVSNPGSLADAPMPPPGDAPDVDAPAPPGDGPGLVQVTVLDPSGSGAPAVGANVVFHGPDGALVKRIGTDTNGKASAEVLAGARVTAITVLNGTQYRIKTVLDVRPGDDIVLGEKPLDATVVGTLNVTLPAHADATIYQVSSPCGIAGATAEAGKPPPVISLPILNHCKRATTELSVLAFNAAVAPVGGLSRQGVGFLTSSAIDLTAQVYAALPTFTSTYSNLDPAISGLSVGRTVPDGAGVSVSANVTRTDTTQSVVVARALGSSARVSTRLSGVGRAFQDIRQDISGAAATYGLDAQAQLLPWLPAPSFDAATATLKLPTDTTGTSDAKPDAVRVTVSYARTNPNTQVTTSFNWVLFAPDTADIVLPGLPAEVGDIAPTAADTVGVSSTMFEADSVPGYSAVRAEPDGAFLLYAPAPPGSRENLRRYPDTTVRNSSSPGRGIILVPKHSEEAR